MILAPIMSIVNIDELIKSPDTVIPDLILYPEVDEFSDSDSPIRSSISFAEIQSFQSVTDDLDSSFHRTDGLLRVRQPIRFHKKGGHSGENRSDHLLLVLHIFPNTKLEINSSISTAGCVSRIRPPSPKISSEPPGVICTNFSPISPFVFTEAMASS